MEHAEAIEKPICPHSSICTAIPIAGYEASALAAAPVAMNMAKL